MAQEMSEGTPPPELHPALPNINRHEIHQIAADLSHAFDDTKLTSAKTLELDQQEQDYLKSRVKADQRGRLDLKGHNKIDLQDRDKLWVALNILYPQDQAETTYLIIRSAQLWSLGATIDPTILTADKLHKMTVERASNDPRVFAYLNTRQVIFGDRAALTLLNQRLNPTSPPVEPPAEMPAGRPEETAPLPPAAARDVAPDVLIPESPPQQDNPVELFNELKSLYQREVNGGYIWEGDVHRILVRLTQALNLPPEGNFKNILDRNEALERGIDHPVNDYFNLCRLLEEDPQLFDRVFNGAPTDIKEAAQKLHSVKDDFYALVPQARAVLDMINSQLQPSQSLVVQKQVLSEQATQAFKNFHDILMVSDPGTQQEILKQALVPYLQACNKALEAGELLVQDKYRSRNKLMETWGGIRILEIRFGQEVTCIDRPSPQSERLLPTNERIRLESLIAQKRKISKDDPDQSDARIQIDKQIEALLDATLSKRKELEFVPEKDKTLPLEFRFHVLYHNNPVQKDLIRRIMQYASPMLQTTFAAYKEAVKAYQENKYVRLVEGTYFDHHKVLNKALDEEAGLTPLNEEVARNAKETSILDHVFNLLTRRPAVDQTTVGELVEAYIRMRKADDSYQLSKKRRIEKYNGFFADLANKAGLKLEVKTRRGYAVTGTGKPFKELVLAGKGILGR